MTGRDYLLNSISQSVDSLESMASNVSFCEEFVKACDVMLYAFRNQNKILFAGNGGSAADAQHMAGEFVSRFNFDRPALPAIALTTDSSILTAIGNDYGYEEVFSRQVSALGMPGDVFLAYSTSGESPNIISALKVAKSQGLTTIGITGNRDGRIVEFSDITLEVPSAMTPHIQEGHLVLGHALCGYIESQMFKSNEV